MGIEPTTDAPQRLPLDLKSRRATSAPSASLIYPFEFKGFFSICSICSGIFTINYHQIVTDFIENLYPSKELHVLLLSNHQAL